MKQNKKIINFISKLKYVKIVDLFSIFFFLLAIFPSIFLKIKHPNIWLICEEKNEARDNGYWFYKYVRENYPEINAVYAINKKSPDYKKIKVLGKAIQYGSFKHWVYYLAASKNISSQKSGKPNAAICYVLEIYEILKNKRFFLQHGITKDDVKYLYYEVSKFSLLVCGAKSEYEYINKIFGYPDGVVKLLGFCRYDNLDIEKENVKHNQILIMPSWREWLAHPTKNSKEYDDMRDIKNTEYHIKWNGLLNNCVLQDLLVDNKLVIIFYPHRNMQKFINAFTVKSEHIIIADWKNYDVQTLLNESSFLITDYSSIFFDFAYMKKPLVYYQFDQENFRKAQYQEGYFSYQNNGFGELVTNEKELIQLIQSYIEGSFKMKDIYSSRVSEFFCFNDKNNCKRNFETINNL
jgi:CDP-glycerol glycerophosphotransferase (TagB/SpsB family)